MSKRFDKPNNLTDRWSRSSIDELFRAAKKKHPVKKSPEYGREISGLYLVLVQACICVHLLAFVTFT